MTLEQLTYSISGCAIMAALTVKAHVVTGATWPESAGVALLVAVLFIAGFAVGVLILFLLIKAAISLITLLSPAPLPVVATGDADQDNSVSESTATPTPVAEKIDDFYTPHFGLE